MSAQNSSIPLEIQLEAVCKLRVNETHALIAPYVPAIQDWDPNSGSADSYRERARSYLTFSPSDLMTFLSAHLEICRSLMLDSYDKRYAPSTFLQEWENNQYRVGWVKAAGDPSITDIRVYSSLADATSDYVLFSWGYPRLSKDQASWHEMDHF